MANCCNDNPSPGCVDCTAAMTYLDTFCQQGCKDLIPTDCVLWSDDPIDGPIPISNGEILTSIIKKLIDGSNVDAIDITWNATTRMLCLINNGVSVRCVNIADQDDQYLVLTTGKHLQIWKPAGSAGTSDDVLVTDIDMNVFMTETTFIAQSESLVITPGGTNGHTPTIEIEPSSDGGNAFILGSDNKPFVPEAEFNGITGIVFEENDYITYETETDEDGVVTVSTTVNIEALAEAICPLCTPTCTPPSNLVVTS